MRLELEPPRPTWTYAKKVSPELQYFFTPAPAPFKYTSIGIGAPTTLWRVDRRLATPDFRGALD